jgi:hypothetical protein
MWESILMLLLLFSLSIFVIIEFTPFVLQAAINLPIIWVILLRAYIEIIDKDKSKIYLISIGVTAALFLLLFVFVAYRFFIWWPTLFLCITYLLAQSINFMENKARKSSH